MANKQDLERETAYLFGCDYSLDAFDPDGTDLEYEHYDRAQALLESKEYPQNDVLNAWAAYLYSCCPTAEDVINYCNLFLYYGGSEAAVPEPYKFCAYLYFRVDVEKYLAEGRDEVFSLLDSVATGVLQKARCVSLVDDPYYAPERDPKVIAEIERMRSETHAFPEANDNRASPDSEYFRLADEIGLDVSRLVEREKNGEEVSYAFSFDLSTLDGVCFENYAEERDKKRWYELGVIVYGPGCEPMFAINILENHQDPRKYDIHVFDDASEGRERKYMVLNIRNYVTSENILRAEIPHGCELPRLKGTIAQIERLMGVKFLRKPVLVHMSRGVKSRKKLAEWLMRGGE